MRQRSRSRQLPLTVFALVGWAVIPAAVAAYDPAPEDQGYQRLDLPAAHSPSDTVNWSVDPVRTALRYRMQRTSVIDLLLPDGAGGTHYFAQLDTNAGVAFPRSATIALLPPTEITLGESVELHERAHLLWASRPDVVARIITSVGKPANDEYAARNAGEHFAEMAGQAWTVIIPPRDVCPIGSQVEWLHDAEERVPGTAGFVVWYLRHPAMRGVPVRDSLLAVAEQMTQSRRAEWEALYAALEERRNDDGAFTPWPPQALAAYLQEVHRQDSGAAAYVMRALFIPSVLVARVYDFAGGARHSR